MPQYLIVAQHPPDLCPSSNETTRGMLRAGAEEIPGLAEKLGVKIHATYVPMTNHQIILAVEADEANSAREFAWQGRLGQWNTVEIIQVATFEEALTRVEELPTIF
jgi:uncharacterized protein with GYD domain